MALKKIIGLLLAMVGAEVLALTLLRQYHQTRRILYFIGAVLMYVAICFMIVAMLNYENIAIVNALWNALSIILVLLIGWLLFGEHVSKLEWIGILLIIVAIAFIFL